MPRDFFTERGATVLANRIKDHWRARGHAIEVRVEPTQAFDHSKTLYVVRSNLLNALPPK